VCVYVCVCVCVCVRVCVCACLCVQDLEAFLAASMPRPAAGGATSKPPP